MSAAPRLVSSPRRVASRCAAPRRVAVAAQFIWNFKIRIRASTRVAKRSERARESLERTAIIGSSRA